MIFQSWKMWEILGGLFFGASAQRGSANLFLIAANCAVPGSRTHCGMKKKFSRWENTLEEKLIEIWNWVFQLLLKICSSFAFLLVKSYVNTWNYVFSVTWVKVFWKINTNWYFLISELLTFWNFLELCQKTDSKNIYFIILQSI